VRVSGAVFEDVCRAATADPGLERRLNSIQERNTFATPHARAKEPRDTCGGLASKISLIYPTQASLKWCSIGILRIDGNSAARFAAVAVDDAFEDRIGLAHQR